MYAITDAGVSSQARVKLFDMFVFPTPLRPREVECKAREWVASGATAVLVLACPRMGDPKRRSASVYRAGDDVRAYEHGEIDLSDAVPGWRVALADFFI